MTLRNDVSSANICSEKATSCLIKRFCLASACGPNNQFPFQDGIIISQSSFAFIKSEAERIELL